MQPWSFPLYCFFQSLLIDCVHCLRANPKRSFSSTSSRDHPQRRFSPPFLLVRPSFPSWVGVPVEASSNTRGRDPQPRRPRRHAILTSYFLSSGGSFPPSTNRVNMSYPLVTGYTILVDRGCPRKTIKRSVVFDLKAGPSSSLLFFFSDTSNTIGKVFTLLPFQNLISTEESLPPLSITTSTHCPQGYCTITTFPSSTLHH